MVLEKGRGRESGKRKEGEMCQIERGLRERAEAGAESTSACDEASPIGFP